MRVLILLTLLFFSIAAICQDKQPPPIGWGVVPALAYDSNTGFGFGAVGTVYRRDPVLKPYSYGFDAQVFLTTLGSHSHFLRADWLDAFGQPLRLRAKLGFYVTKSENYCGKGSLANCPEVVPAEVFEIDRPYYNLYRYIEPYLILEGRYKLLAGPPKMEVLFGWRGSYYMPGDLFARVPYPGSLYAADFGPSLNQGFASVIEAGVMFDARDNEPAPKKGYWIESTVRESSLLFGSQWSYVGFNLSMRGYLPLDPWQRLVLAGQAIFDGMVGDAPLQEIVRVGGSLQQTAFGGHLIGRGLRSQLYPGRVKFLKQAELRYTFYGFDILTEHFDLGLVAFADAAVIAWDFQKLGIDPMQLMVGFGGGLRITWSENFVIRFDTAVSPNERYNPQFYVKIGHVF